MTINSDLQKILFKAAKLGDVKMMRELIKAGADPFLLDKMNHDAFYYAYQSKPKETEDLRKETESGKLKVFPLFRHRIIAKACEALFEEEKEPNILYLPNNNGNERRNKSKRPKKTWFQTILLAFSLFACSSKGDHPTPEYKGSAHAKATKAEVHLQYLACYALNEEEKKQCLDRLNTKYIDEYSRKDAKYVQAYQFESEKLGFKHFLNNLGIECEAIDDGPIFKEDRKAYLVTCKPNGEYLMRFNYETKEWQLINKEEKEGK